MFNWPNQTLHSLKYLISFVYIRVSVSEIMIAFILKYYFLIRTLK
jgi:hypothetical protein